VIQPALIVPLGRHALARFDRSAKIGDVHGHPLQVGGRDLFPLYHPAAALHGGKLRATLIEDARRLGATLG
jgi:DNA polymerase